MSFPSKIVTELEQKIVGLELMVWKAEKWKTRAINQKKELARLHESRNALKEDNKKLCSTRDGWRWSYESLQEEGYDALLDHVEKLNKLLALNVELLNRTAPHEERELEEARDEARKYYDKWLECTRKAEQMKNQIEALIEDNNVANRPY